MSDLGDRVRQRAADIVENVLDPQACGVAVVAVLDLHSPRRIYEPCGHNHADSDPGTVEVQDGDVGITCEDGYLYTICRDCCTGNGYQTEQCAADHDGDCYPCATVKAIAEALGLDTSSSDGMSQGQARILSAEGERP